MDATDLDADPPRQLSTWLDAARAAGQPMPEAMTIASATSDGVPSARLVVLRGFRVLPSRVEFWQESPDGIHDRIRYRREGSGWIIERLSP